MLLLKRPRNWLLTPLIYLAALLLVIEEWSWDVGHRLVLRIATWPPWRALENRIRLLQPYPALCAFVLPGLLLFPVKLLALYAIGNGYPFTGLLAVILAKVGGAAVAARLYALTRHSLLSLDWFARWHNKFLLHKEIWVGRLRASVAWQAVIRHAANMRAALRRAWHDVRPSTQIGGRNGTYPVRLMRRFIAMWKARRR